jgi:hypothetical protein
MSNANPLSHKAALKALGKTGARLMLMHDNSKPGGGGMSYFIVPGGRVDEIVAKSLIARPDVSEQNDGLFVGHPQTWQFVR